MTTIALNKAADRVLLSARARHFTDGMMWGRVRLYYNRIEFSGIGLGGRVRRVIQLSEVQSVDWFVDRSGEPNIVLLGPWGLIGFWVKPAGIWRFKIDGLLSCKNDVERGIFASGYRDDAHTPDDRENLSSAA
ncbi:MAG: hypothetical protein R2832_18320 [Rhodothermales bacterium]